MTTRRRRPGSEKVLTAQLRELEDDGIITRLVTEGVPLRVDYMLSDGGMELVPVTEAMCDWGTKHLGVPPSLPRLQPMPDQTGAPHASTSGALPGGGPE